MPLYMDNGDYPGFQFDAIDGALNAQFHQQIAQFVGAPSTGALPPQNDIPQDTTAPSDFDSIDARARASSGYGTPRDQAAGSSGVPPSSPPAATPPASPYNASGAYGPDAQSSEPVATGGQDELHAYARQAATRAGIDPEQFVRQIQQESSFDPTARNPSGATGIAQIVPAYHPGVDPTDPRASLDYAANLMATYGRQYGGDQQKALAAYNAGPGNVEKYGGVPPFEETKNYIANILGGAGQAVGGAVSAAANAVQGIGKTANQQSQFGDPTLTADEAYAACGPAAAVRFAQAYGRNPTLREATDLAKQVGWTPDQGMAGIGSEQALLQKMGVPTKVVGPDWQAIAKEAQTGNPVTISTPGHYFYADGYDPQSGAFHVGASGTDLRGGSEWMTPEQMQARMGAAQGALFADHPNVAASSTAGAQGGASAENAAGQAFGGSPQDTAQPQSFEAIDAKAAQGYHQSLADFLMQGIGSGASTAVKTLTGSTPEELGQGLSTLAQAAPQAADTAVKQATGSTAGELGQAAQDTLGPGGLGEQALNSPLTQPLRAANDTILAPMRESEAAFQKSLRGEPLTPEEERAANNFLLAVAGIEGPAEGAGAAMKSLIPGAAEKAGAAANAAGDLFGPFRYGPADQLGAEALYHETSPESALSLANSPFTAEQLHLTPYPDLALGQGGQGAVVEFAPSSNYSVAAQRTKPSAAFIEQQGGLPAELVGDIPRAGENVRAVTIKPGAPMTYVARGLLKRLGWPSETLADGSVRYTNPNLAATEASGGIRGAIDNLLSPKPAQASVGAASGADLAKAVANPVNQVFAPARNAPEVVQQAISDFANQAGQQSKAVRVEAENLANRVKTVLGPLDQDPQAIVNFEKTGQFTPNPTPEQAQLASDLRDFFQQRHAEGQAGGYIKGDATAPWGGPLNYFPHQYEDPAVAQAQRSGTFNPSDFYSRQRFYPTMEEALAAGKQPVPLSQAVATYAEHTGSSQAKVDLANALKNAGPDIAQEVPDHGPMPQGMVPVNDPSPGSPFRGWLFEPNTARAVSNLISGSSIRSTGVGSAMMQGLSIGKQTLFSLSNFHTLTETMNGLFANGLRGPAVVRDMVHAFVSPDFYQGIRYGRLGDDFVKAAKDGVTGLSAPTGDVETLGNLGPKATALVRAGVGGVTGYAGGYQTAKATGASDEDAIKAGLASGAVTAALGPKLAPAINKGLWERAVPTAKVLTYKIATEGGADGKAAADFVNNTFGGQNLTAMARSRGVQDISRIMLLAPDWTESTWKTVANTLAPNQQGTLTRNYVLSALAGLGFVTEGVNYALNGHFTDQNAQGHQFQIEVPTGMTDKRGLPDHTYIALFPGNLQQVLDAASKQDPNAYITNRTAPLPRAFEDWQTNKDFAGNDIVPSGTPPFQGIPQYASYEAGRFAPVGVSNVGNELNRGAPLPLAMASSLTGLKLAHETGTSAIMQQRDQIVASQWPQIEKQIRSSPPFQVENQARQQQILRTQHDQYVQDVGKRLGLTPVDSGMPQKYRGVTDRAQEMAIDAAKAKVSAFERDPRNAPRPTRQEVTLAARGVETREYQQEQQARQRENRGYANTWQNAPLPIAP